MKQRPPRDNTDQVDVQRMLTAIVDAAPVSLCVIGLDGRVALVEGQAFPDIGLVSGTANTPIAATTTRSAAPKGESVNLRPA